MGSGKGGTGALLRTVSGSPGRLVRIAILICEHATLTTVPI